MRSGKSFHSAPLTCSVGSTFVSIIVSYSTISTTLNNAIFITIHHVNTNTHLNAISVWPILRCLLLSDCVACWWLRHRLWIRRIRHAVSTTSNITNIIAIKIIINIQNRNTRALLTYHVIHKDKICISVYTCSCMCRELVLRESPMIYMLLKSACSAAKNVQQETRILVDNNLYCPIVPPWVNP